METGETEKYLVKFEKLPTFGHACGLMGHWYEECGTGEHDASKFEWGSFLLAPRRGRGGGRGGRNNGGRGRGESYEGNSHDPANSTGRGRGGDFARTTQVEGVGKLVCKQTGDLIKLSRRMVLTITRETRINYS